ncbi:MAG: sulfatase-like hydrolase/transferase [Halioglobus sp.]|nr:sulfatase-like hydrolase/transferase [Halioglobus sp.]
MARDQVTFAIAAIALFLLAFYLAPLDVLLMNSRDIKATPSSVLVLMWPAQLAFLFLVVLALLFAPVFMLRAFACTFLALSALLYVQGNFFIWDYGPLDGTNIDWRAHNASGFLELFVWAAALLLAPRYASKLWPHVRTLALVIVLLQASAIVVMLLSGKSFPRGASHVARQIDESVFEFSVDRNVLLIVLDTFSSPLFADIVEKDPSIRNALDGFINFRDTLGVSPFTLLSIPTILSSLVYENVGTIQAFMGYALGEESLPSVLQRSGYQSHVITMGTYRDYLRWLPGYDLTTVLYDGDADRESKAALQNWDLVLFRYLPHFLKQKVYRGHRWLLQGFFLHEGHDVLGDGRRRMELAPMQMASRILVRRFMDYASSDSESPTFKMIHLFTSHPPFLMRADGGLLTESEFEATPVSERALAQDAYAMREALAMLETLRALGVYDHTLVIIAADHGTDITKNTRPVYKRRAHPLMLVKPFESRGALRNSWARASLLDIPLTVSRALDLDGDYAGYDVLGDDLPADRERHFHYFNWAGKEFWNIDQLPSMTKYRIDGPVHVLGAWQEACALPPVMTRIEPCL